MKIPAIVRSNAVLVVLFATAFFGVLLLTRGVDGQAGSSSRQESASFGVGPILNRHRGGDSALPSLSSHLASSEERRTASRVPSAEEIRDSQQASRDALEAEEGEDRGVAIRKLESARTPDAVAALVQVVRNDPDVRNRLLAINSLSALAHSGYEAGSIRSELEAVAHDSDSNVASHAAEAYEELSAAGGTSASR